MMTIEERLKMYREKRQFIYEVSKTFEKVPGGHSVAGVFYEVLFKESEMFGTEISEWIVIQFKGGAVAYRVISGNSNSANFQVIASMIEGGCYGQNPTHARLLAEGWKRLDLNQMSSYKEAK